MSAPHPFTEYYQRQRRTAPARFPLAPDLHRELAHSHARTEELAAAQALPAPRPRP